MNIEELYTTSEIELSRMLLDPKVLADPKSLEAIMNLNPILDVQYLGTGPTPLDLAILFRFNTSAGILIDAGADLNQRFPGKRSPLHHAACNGNLTIVEHLIEAGTSLDAQDRYGLTPIFHAIRNGHLRVTEILIKAGASLDIQDDLGYRPLHMAVRCNKLEICKLLVEHGESIYVSDNTGLYVNYVPIPLSGITFHGHRNPQFHAHSEYTMILSSTDALRFGSISPMRLAMSYKYDQIVNYFRSIEESAW